MSNQYHRIALYVSITLVNSFIMDRVRADVRSDVLVAAKRATEFLTERVSTRGGYLWRYSSDLQLREGEGVVTTETVWVQPPGTPTVGAAFLRLYDASRDPQFLNAARQAAEALRLGQMRSGGWQAMIEFEPARRARWAYRVDPARDRAKDQSSLDDDKTQSALRFVMRLDRTLKFREPAIHEMALYALDGLINRAQFPNGGFPQIWSGGYERPSLPDVRASYPASWSREYSGHREYWHRYTLNDNLMHDVIETLFLAEEIYDEPRYRTAALRAADFLCLAQMPSPQPAWAQQYNFDMQPMWARKFEPPAITGGESQGVIEILLTVYSRTHIAKYLEPIPAALDYLERSQLADGRLARFYELQTNRPLYMTRDYQLTYDDGDVPTHYSFKVASRMAPLRRRYEAIKSDAEPRPNARPQATVDQVRRVVNGLDERGAWVSNERLRYHDSQASQTISMRHTVNNLLTLANFLEQERPSE